LGSKKKGKGRIVTLNGKKYVKIHVGEYGELQDSPPYLILSEGIRFTTYEVYFVTPNESKATDMEEMDRIRFRIYVHYIDGKILKIPAAKRSDIEELINLLEKASKEGCK